MPWSKGLLFYDVAQHFADSVKLASGGRLDIKLFSAGELVGAMESFDARQQRPGRYRSRLAGLLEREERSIRRLCLGFRWDWIQKATMSGCMSVAARK